MYCGLLQEAFMRRELKNIAEYKKSSNDAFASVVRSFGDANSRFQALAVESVGRAVEIQSEFVSKAYDNYISEISKLGRMFFVGYRTFTARPQELPHANLNEKAADRPQALEAKVNPDPARRRTAAQSMTTKRKAGTVAKSQSGKRSTKAKRKVGSVRRGKS
jgi:Tfp pilus assembly protein PilP